MANFTTVNMMDRCSHGMPRYENCWTCVQTWGSFKAVGESLTDDLMQLSQLVETIPVAKNFARGELLIWGDELVTFEMSRPADRVLVRKEDGHVVEARRSELTR